MVIELDDKDRHKAVGFCSALVALGLIDIEEFMSVLVLIEDARVEEELVSEAFLLKLTDYYLNRM